MKKPMREYYVRVGDEDVRVNDPTTTITTTAGDPGYSFYIDGNGFRIEVGKYSKKIKQTMKTKKHKVEIPEGYEVDETLSSFDSDEDKAYITITLNPIKKELPKTWREFILKNPGECNWLMELDNYQDEFVALYKLLRLRDVYNDGWVASHDNADDKFSLVFIEGEIRIVNSCKVIYPLTFKTEELRRSFLDNFSELIEQAKPLL